MEGFIRHLKGRFHIIVLSPVYWCFIILLILGLFAGFWAEIPRDIQTRDWWFGVTRWFLSGVMSAMLLGGRSTTSGRVLLKQLAMVNLPVGRRARVAADVTFLSIILIVARVIQLTFSETISPGLDLSITISGVAAMIPIFVVYTPRERQGQIFHLLDSVIVGVGTVIFLRAGWYISPLMAILSCIVLVLLTEIANTLAIRLNRLPLPKSGYSGSLDRPSRNPARQFQRDLWLGSLQHNGWSMVGLTGLLLLCIGLCSFFHYPQIVLIICTGTFLYLLFCTMLAPAGTACFVTEPGEKAAFYGDFDGSFLSAWSVLPVSHLQIVRGVYLYVTSIALLFWIGSLLTFILTGWPYSFHFWVPFLIAIPCLAGFCTMSAIGNKPLSLFLSILFCVELIIGTGLLDNGFGAVGALILSIFLMASFIPVFPYLIKK